MDQHFHSFKLQFSSAILIVFFTLQPSALARSGYLDFYSKAEKICPEFKEAFDDAYNCDRKILNTKGKVHLSKPLKVCAIFKEVIQNCWSVSIKNISNNSKCEPFKSEWRSLMNFAGSLCKRIEKDSAELYNETYRCIEKDEGEILSACGGERFKEVDFNTKSQEDICSDFIVLENCITNGTSSCSSAVKSEIQALYPVFNQFLQSFGFILPSCELKIVNHGVLSSGGASLPFVIFLVPLLMKF